jgi:hypothetical protein
MDKAGEVRVQGALVVIYKEKRESGRHFLNRERMDINVMYL